MNIIEFFLSQEVTLSSKLLEILYICIGMIVCYSAYRNAFDKSNPHRYGTAFFWGMLGILFMMGKWLPSSVTGVFVMLLVIPVITGKTAKGKLDKPTQEEMQQGFQKIGMKIFIPALCIGLTALCFALFTDISSIAGVGVGVGIAIIILMLMSKENRSTIFLKDARRMLDTVGPMSLLPILLATLGAVFTAAGVGEVISSMVSHIIPSGNLVIGILVYAIGMALFTMVMGNAFAAITVMSVGIGAPFVLALGADPTIVGSLALTCGFCGTLITPMAANFNMVPVAILEMKDKYGVIKKQILVAVILLIFQIIYMIMMS